MQVLTGNKQDFPRFRPLNPHLMDDDLQKIFKKLIVSRWFQPVRYKRPDALEKLPNSAAVLRRTENLKALIENWILTSSTAGVVY